jgi:hypothetical protein
MSEDNREWRCFFCDEVFTSEREAGLHFGTFDSCEPDVTACKLMSHQQHVLEYIRELEDEVRLYQSENHSTVKAVYAVHDEMQRAIKKAEEVGYNKAVQDMKSQGFCPEPQKHTV